MPGPQDDAPGREPLAGERRFALLVAVTQYADPALRMLRAPAADAIALRDLLADPEVGGFAVTSVIDERAQGVRLAVEDFLVDRTPDDVVLVYLSCHGLVDLRRRLYFAARDTLKSRLASSGVEAHWLLEQLEDCRARRQVVILDCCFSGAFAQGSKGDDDLALGERLMGEGRGRVVLTASRGTEYSFEGEPVDGELPKGSVFTSALVDGISSGAADTDSDGYVSVDDAYSFAFERVRAGGAQQTPQRWLYGAEGSIVLARVPRVDPPPMPRAVRESAPLVEPVPAPARGSRSRRLLLAAVAGLLLALAIVGGVLLRDGWPGGDDGGDSGESTAVERVFTESMPWRLQIHSDKDGSGPCYVSVSDSDGAHAESLPKAYDKTFQMHRTGRLRYRASDPQCVVVPLAGPGNLALPSPVECCFGDTDAFKTDGSIEVQMDPEHPCGVTLNAVADGNPVAFVRGEDADGSGIVHLDPGTKELVYIKDVGCEMTVRPVD